MERGWKAKNDLRYPKVEDLELGNEEKQVKEGENPADDRAEKPEVDPGVDYMRWSD